MRPTVDGDRSNVACAGKAPFPKHAIKLVADALLEVVEGHRQQLAPTDAELGACIQRLVGRARHVYEMKQCRPRRIAGVMVAAEIDRRIELYAAMKRPGRGNVMHTQSDPRMPVSS